jgi:hypothetical protein
MVKEARQRRQRAETNLRGVFEELLFEQNPELGLRSFWTHAIRGAAFESLTAESIWPMFLANYLSRDHANSRVDEARVAHDLATWPPIVRRVAEIRAGK